MPITDSQMRPEHEDVPLPPVGVAPRLARASLLCLLGFVGALVVFVVWQFAMQTSGGFNQIERVTGWSAVLRELPAFALLLAPVALGLALGIRATRFGARRGIVAICLHSAVLFIAVALFASDVEDAFRQNGGSLASLLVAAPVAVGTLVLCLLRGSQHAVPTSAMDGANVRSRPALVVWLAGLAGALLWLLIAQLTLSSIAGDFHRSALPGTVTVAAAHEQTYWIYGEGNAPNTLDEIGVTVTGPMGGDVATQSVTPQAQYLRGLRGGRVVGSFEARTPGTYRVTAGKNVPVISAPFAPSNPNGDFAVGGSVAGWMRPHEIGASVLLALSLVMSGALVVVSSRRRHETTSAGRAS